MTEHAKPNTMDAATQALWDNWVDDRIAKGVNGPLDAIADEAGKIVGQIESIVVEQLAIMQLLAAGADPYVRGRIDQLVLRFDRQLGIKIVERVVERPAKTEAAPETARAVVVKRA